MVRRNPCRIEGADKEKSGEREIVPLPVVFAIANAVPVRYHALVLLATFADLRRNGRRTGQGRSAARDTEVSRRSAHRRVSRRAGAGASLAPGAVRGGRRAFGGDRREPQGADGPSRPLERAGGDGPPAHATRDRDRAWPREYDLVPCDLARLLGGQPDCPGNRHVPGRLRAKVGRALGAPAHAAPEAVVHSLCRIW
jgi:hypothetical protein